MTIDKVRRLYCINIEYIQFSIHITKDILKVNDRK